MDPKDPKDAPAVEAKENEPALVVEAEPKVELDAEPVAEPKVEPKVEIDTTTVGEALDTNPGGTNKDDPSPAPRMVPEAVFLEMKKDLKKLQDSIDKGDMSKPEISEDIAALSEKHDVDESFLAELISTIESKTKKELESELAAKFAPIQEAERAKKIDEAFTKHFSKAMETMPEFEGIVKKEVIKNLSLNQANANKTFAEIIEETYGHLIEGRSTIAPKAPGARKNDSEIDMLRMNTDSTYYQEIMDDPVRKKKYNEGLTGRLSSAI